MNKAMHVAAAYYVGSLWFVGYSDSLVAWKSEGRRGVWLSIPLMRSELISVAAEVSKAGWYYLKWNYKVCNRDSMGEKTDVCVCVWGGGGGGGGG